MRTDGLSTRVAEYWQRRGDVLGALPDLDFALFDQVLGHQRSSGTHGDLLEIGALYGASAILLGLHAEPDETVVVCDVFESDVADEDVARENRESYPGLTQQAFERNYRGWVSTPPRVVRELSDQISRHVAPSSLRFAHVDGSHLYDVVVQDLRNVRALLGPGGVAVLDDYREMHTPGVAAAAWSAVVSDGLVPFCLSEQKLYGTWDPEVAAALRDRLRRWAEQREEQVEHGQQTVAGHPVLLLAATPTGGRSLRHWAGHTLRALGLRRPTPVGSGRRHLGRKG